MADDRLQTALENVGLGTMYSRFLDERIDVNDINALSDNDLARLGVETIGDRLRLRTQVRRLTSLSESQSIGKLAVPLPPPPPDTIHHPLRIFVHFPFKYIASVVIYLNKTVLNRYNIPGHVDSIAHCPDQELS